VPNIIEAFPEEDEREIVTQAIEEINTAIKELVEEEEIGLADVYSITKKLIEGEPFYFGAIEFKGLTVNETDGDVTALPPDEHNDPHYLFTRDGFHPNTALQIQIARIFIRAFNDAYDANIPVITHAEALKLLHINPREPYRHWIEEPRIPEVKNTLLLADPDDDKMTNLMEYAFDTQPQLSNEGDLPFWIGGPVEGISSEFSVNYDLPEVPRREIDIAVQYKVGTRWIRVPAGRVVTDEELSSVQVAIPLTAEGVPLPLRIKVSLIPPQGSLNTVSSVINIGVVTPTFVPPEP
jgi:hypothetical protein